MPLLDEEAVKDENVESTETDEPTEENNNVSEKLKEEVVVKPETKVEVSYRDSREIKPENIINYAEGYSYIVDYYNLEKTKDETSSLSDENMSGTLQQYNLIKGLILKLPSEIDFSELSSTEAEAIIYLSSLKPKVGDVVVADMLDGKKGIFDVIDTSDKSHIREKPYGIKFKFKKFLDDSANKDLKSKIIRTFIYNEKGHNDSSSILVSEEDYKKYLRINNEINYLEKYYISKFLNTDYDFFLVPNDSGEIITDKAMEQMLTKVLKSRPSFNSNDYNPVEKETVLDLLISRNVRVFSYISNNFIKDKIDFDSRSFSPYNDLSCLGISHEIILNKKDIEITDEEKEKISTLVFNEIKDDFYIFSKMFYGFDKHKNSNSISILEKEVINLIDSRKVNLSNLITLLDEYRNLDDLRQYYFIPIIIVLLRYVGFNNISEDCL